MATLIENTQRAIAAFDRMATNIETKGVNVPADLTVEEQVDKILEIRNDSADPTKPVLFFDYKGTLLASYTIEEARELTELPPLPSDELTIGTSWTHTLEQVNNTVGALHVGATPRSRDGKTHIFGRVTRVSGAPTIKFTINGSATYRVDWGDETYVDTSAVNVVLNAPYTDPQDYHITIERIAGDGTITIGGTGHAGCLMGSASNSRQSATGVIIGDNVDFANYAIYGLGSLRFVAIPGGVTGVPNYALASCKSLTAVVIPAGVTSIGSQAFAGCASLNDITIKGVIPAVLENTNSFSSPTAIRKFWVPDESVDAYKTAENWSTYAEYIYPISEMR